MRIERHRVYISITVVLLVSSTGCLTLSAPEEPSLDIQLSNLDSEREAIDLEIRRNSTGEVVLDNSTSVSPDQTVEYYDKFEKGNEYVVVVSTNSGKETTFDYDALGGSASILITIDEDGISWSSGAG